MWTLYIMRSGNQTSVCWFVLIITRVKYNWTSWSTKCLLCYYGHTPWLANISSRLCAKLSYVFQQHSSQNAPSFHNSKRYCNSFICYDSAISPPLFAGFAKNRVTSLRAGGVKSRDFWLINDASENHSWKQEIVYYLSNYVTVRLLALSDIWLFCKLGAIFCQNGAVIYQRTTLCPKKHVTTFSTITLTFPWEITEHEKWPISPPQATYCSVNKQH